jgi:hypothetical protein
VCISRLSDYLSYLENSRGTSALTLYRGQESDWPLLPNIARQGLDSEMVTAVESNLFAAFQREALTFLEVAPSNPWDWIAVAQHHRLPTRLLDWTKNPLAALWFAVRQPGTHPSRPGVIWTLQAEDADIVCDVSGNPSQYDRSLSARSPLEVPKTVVFEPRHVIARIGAQAGVFTVHKYLDDKSQFIPLEKDPAYCDRLRKVVVPSDRFTALRRQLLVCGIHDASLFSDLDGLASRIKMELCEQSSA